MNGLANLAALVFGGLFAWMVIACSGEQEGRGQKYLPYLNSGMLPGYVIMMLVINGMYASWEGDNQAWTGLVSWVFEVFLQVSLYFLLLALVLPLLRRYIRAGACAMLWIIPNYLYLTYSTNRYTMPRWVIPLPGGWLEAAGVIWLTGMLAVLGWKIVAHLRFRRRLLREAEPVSDPEVLSVWEETVEWARMKRMRYRLVISPQATTPMSIGLFWTSTRVVLPRRHYTPEELKLIFRHELVHISREDAWNKFFLAFCTAVCWFNPLMWLAVRRSSEDLELSCDETVLSELKAGERRQYAQLILRTAGDSRGFTTCLSASATALRYRLRSIMKPGRKLPGALLVGVIFFPLYVTCGQVGLAYGAGTGQADLFPGEAGMVSLTEATWTGERPYVPVSCRDEGALEDYLSSLTLYRLFRDDANSSAQDQPLLLTYDTPKGPLSMTLWRNYVTVMPSWEEITQWHNYYVSGGLDWERLGQLFDR